MDEQIQKQLGIIDEWRKVATMIGSKPISDLLDGYAAALRQIVVNREREKQGMAREFALKAENDLLKKENESLKVQRAAMLAHPDVRADEAAKIAEQISKLQSQYAKLVTPTE